MQAYQSLLRRPVAAKITLLSSASSRLRAFWVCNARGNSLPPTLPSIAGDGLNTPSAHYEYAIPAPGSFAPSPRPGGGRSGFASGLRTTSALYALEPSEGRLVPRGRNVLQPWRKAGPSLRSAGPSISASYLCIRRKLLTSSPERSRPLGATSAAGGSSPSGGPLQGAIWTCTRRLRC